MIKKIGHIILITLGVLILLNVILLFSLNTSFVQQKIVRKVTSTLSEKTGTNIEIGHIQIDLFDGLFLEDLFLEDTHHDTLAFIHQLNVNYSLKNIYRHKTLSLSRVAIQDFVINLTKENDSTDYNYQFLVDAFSSDKPDTSASSPFQMEIGQILLIDGSFRHSIKDAEKTEGLFNANDLQVDSINANLSLGLYLPSFISSEIDNISLKEKSGLTLRHLDAEGTFYLDSLISIPSLILETQNSQLSGDSIEYHLSNQEIFAKISESSIVPSDFKCFSSAIDSLSSPIAVKTSAHVLLPAIEINNTQIDYPDVLTVSANHLSIEDINNWQSSKLSALINKLEANRQLSSELKKTLGIELPTVVDSLLPCSASLQLNGSLPQLKEELTLETPIGSVSTKGNTSYLHEQGILNSNNDWNVNITTLKPIILSDMVEHINGQLESSLAWNLKNSDPIIHLSSIFPAITINHYDYDTLRLNGVYKGKEDLTIGLSSPDPNCHLSLNANIKDLMTDKMQSDVTLDIRHIATEKLHLTDSTQNITVQGAFKVNGTGMDYNQWNGTIEIDSLALTNNDAHYAIPYIKVKQETQGESKKLALNTPFLNGNMHGVFKYEEIYPCFINVMQKYLPTFFQLKQSTETNTDLAFRFDISNIDSLMNYLNIDLHTKEKITISGALNEKEKSLKMELNTPEIIYNKLAAEPSRIHFASHKRNNTHALIGSIESKIHPNKEDPFNALFSGEIIIQNDSVYNKVKVSTAPDTAFLKGNFYDCISFHPLGEGQYKINVNLYPSNIILHQQELQNNEALVQLLPDKILISNFGLSANQQHLLLADGILSSSLNDTLYVTFDDLKLQTILGLMYRNDIPADCNINGKLKACAILGENFRFSTRGFKMDSIRYNDIEIGNMNLSAVWDNARKGVFAKMKLDNGNQHLMDIKGVIEPAKQQMKMTAFLDSIPLQLAMPIASEYVSNLKGNIGANITAEGSFSNLDINGYVYLKNAQAKVNYTGVTYFISDSIKLNGNHFYAKRFKVRDDNNNILFFDGDVTHKEFKTFNYKMRLNMKDFALLNNPKSRSNMVYGTFFVNGKDLVLQGNENGAEITGELSNAEGTSVNIILPETVTETHTYDNIVYVKSEVEEEKDTVKKEVVHPSNFDLYANLSVGLTEKASFYVNLADGAMIRGNGNLRVLYEDNDLFIYNRFTVNDGYLKVKLSGLPTKKFSFQEGSYVDFTGDPMKLKFNATATYSLTADLTTLSSSFSTMGIKNTHVPVNCNLIASGNLEDMTLSYDVALPKAEKDIQQAVASIINTDNIRIKEFAYLIGVGMFSDPSNEVQGNALMSFASSSLSATLNNVLGKFLGEKVTIGTDISSSDNSSEYDVGVSVSTKLAKDKLLVSTNMELQNAGGEDENFMADFDAEYLLGKTGMFRIKAYNHSNDDFYRPANSTTQGIGISFVRESKKISELFKIKNEFNTPKRKEKKKEKINSKEKNKTENGQPTQTNSTPKEEEEE